MEETRSNGSKLHQERFYLDSTKMFFTERTIFLWNNLLRDVVESLLMEVFQNTVDQVIDQFSPRFPFPQKAGPEDLSRCLPTRAVV